MQGMFGQIEPDYISTDCLPMHVVNAAQFYADKEPRTLRPPGLDPDIPYVVMVGVKMPSMHDYVQTPVYDKLPGIFLHAFAFENLWRLDAGYYWLKDLTYYGLLAWCLCVIYFMWQAKRFAKRRRTPRRMHHILFWWLVIGLSVVVIQVVFHNLMRIVPEGWLSLVALLPLLREVVLRLEADPMQQGETE
ncbi:CHASE2 domain-containing protein [Salinicola salarius]|uniref:CHASE2 domain-containing protein n=1 Tax=Salinicola salarius TaxID=430457 RepID=UPI000B3FC0E6|nr:CHASE2 domain-containing protein [Salinicola salarius]